MHERASLHLERLSAHFLREFHCLQRGKRERREWKDEILRNESGNDLLEIFKCTNIVRNRFRLIDHTPRWCGFFPARRLCGRNRATFVSHSIFHIQTSSRSRTYKIFRYKLNIKHNKMSILFIWSDIVVLEWWWRFWCVNCAFNYPTHEIVSNHDHCLAQWLIMWIWLEINSNRKNSHFNFSSGSCSTDGVCGDVIWWWWWWWDDKSGCVLWCRWLSPLPNDPTLVGDIRFEMDVALTDDDTSCRLWWLCRWSFELDWLDDSAPLPLWLVVCPLPTRSCRHRFVSDIWSRPPRSIIGSG